ncbi:MAG: hypothetical protein KF752_09385 [Pirellulaceae bacterium]|nr:hypothetical protein [Pirellulaceae bacterium]
MSEESEIRRVMFVGAEQAGKTTMMCGWLHLAKEVYNADPVLKYEQTAQLLETYDHYISATVVNPTNPGEVTRARFHCQQQHHKFDLELIDYSGEDISTSASKFLHQGTSQSLNSLERGFVDDLENADWIILVHDSERIVNGTVAELVSSLWLAKVMPRLLFAGGDGAIANATIYLSRGDRIGQEDIDRAVDSVRAVIQTSNLAALPIKCGSAKVWEQKGQSASERRFVQLFTETMLSVLNRPAGVVISKSHAPGYGRWPFIFACMAIVFVSIWIFSQWQPRPVDPNLQQLLAELDSLENDAAKSPDHAKAQEIVAQLNQLESKLRTVFSSQYGPELSARIVDLRSDLDKVKKPLGTEKIADAIVVLRKLHGPNLKGFYAGLAELAEKERMNDLEWQKDARDEWGVIKKFCEQIRGGIPVGLVSSSFKGPYWWTSTIGSDELKLEVWVAEPGDPQPFDTYTDELASLGTEIKGSVQSGNEYSVRWPGAVAEQSSLTSLLVNLDFDTQVWVRLYTYDFTNKTLAFVKVPREGTLGLDWFNRSQAIRINDKNYALFVRINVDLNVPAAIEEAFKD